jgi:long-chain acyl-CoA synthetase
MQTGGAEFVPSVPRLFEKMKTQILHLAAGKGMAQRALRLCIWSSTEHYRNPHGCGLLATIAYKGTDAVRRSLSKKLFGPKFVHAISGGAKLPTDVFEFFAALDIQILEGYGLTETCVATHVNRPGHARSGTVGTAFRGIETKIEADGEICLRGPNVTHGYYKKPEDTAAAWDGDGWFHTGDLGAIDADGYLSITGRKKDLIITAGGKKVAPQKIEGLLQSNPLISHAVLVGEGKPYCAALVSLHGPIVGNLAKAKGASIGMLDDPPLWLIEEVQSHIDVCNKGLASFERVKKFAILPNEPSIENGLLTPTLKIKRAQVRIVYQDLIESLYSTDQKGHAG